MQALLAVAKRFKPFTCKSFFIRAFILYFLFLYVLNVLSAWLPIRLCFNQFNGSCHCGILRSSRLRFL